MCIVSFVKVPEYRMDQTINLGNLSMLFSESNLKFVDWCVNQAYFVLLN